MKAHWVPLLATAVAGINGALIAYMHDASIDVFSSIAIVLCLAIAVLSWRKAS